MRRNTGIVFICLLALLFFSGQSWADYTANSVQDVYDVLHPIDDMELYSDSVIINGQTVSWIGEDPIITFYVNGKKVATSDDSISYSEQGAYEEEMRIYGLIAQALGIGTLGGFTSPASAAAKATGLIFSKVVMPTVKTRKAKEKASALKTMNKTRTFGGQLRYANIEQNDSNGDLIGCNVGMAHDFKNFTIGGILPYDYVEINDIFEANRMGLILYAQYFYNLTSTLDATFTGNINYLYTDIDYDFGNSDNIDTYGGGLSTALTLDLDAYVVSLALSYQYNQDDIDTEDDHQHLIKVGANAGYRIGQNIVVTLFSVLNQDITDYKYLSQDETYFDIGTEATIGIGDTFVITAGYKKVVALDNYDSDEIYLGSRLNF